jgi:hypothetical protein
MQRHAALTGALALRRLMDAEDPEEEPYRSKYEARRLIEEWLKNSGSVRGLGARSVRD